MEFTPEILMAVVGACLGYLVRLTTADSKRRSDLARMEGQITQVIAYMSGIEDVKIEQAVMNESQKTLAKDLNEAYRRLRILEEVHL